MLVDGTKYIFLKFVDEYGVYDEDGCLVDMSDEAPDEVKKSFEEYKKMQAKFEEQEFS